MTHWCVKILLGGSHLLLLQCTATLQGEPVDLVAVATPPVVQMPAPASPPVSTPGSNPGRALFRAWIPREILANGDETEGHYLEVSPLAPAEEVVAPAVHIPRAPKHVSPTPKATPKVRTLQPPPPEPLPFAAPIAPPVPFPGQPGLSVPLPGLGGER
jgi:hypothetical protein